jgi:hypothetical protein
VALAGDGFEGTQGIERQIASLQHTLLHFGQIN